MDNVVVNEACTWPAGKSALLEGCIAPHFPENRQACIAAAAYRIAQRRGFAPGHELDDWLAAEKEVDERLAGEGRAF